MNSAQLATLRSALVGTTDPALAAFVATRDDYSIAQYLNDYASPAWYAWRLRLSRHEILTGTSDEGTTFAWAGGAYITRSQGERDAFREMFNDSGSVNPALANIQSAFADIFSGAGGAGNRAHILAMSRMPVTRFQRIFATGTGTKVSPGTIVLEGPVSVDEVSQALSLT